MDEIINFLKKYNEDKILLENENSELKNQNKKLLNDIQNLSKVSIISNLDKQLKEKTDYIDLLEKQNTEKINIINQLKLELEEYKMANFTLVTYKKINYYINEKTNDVYDIVKEKPNKIVGIYLNEKIKLNKN